MRTKLLQAKEVNITRSGLNYYINIVTLNRTFELVRKREDLIKLQTQLNAALSEQLGQYLEKLGRRLLEQPYQIVIDSGGLPFRQMEQYFYDGLTVEQAFERLVLDQE